LIFIYAYVLKLIYIVHWSSQNIGSGAPAPTSPPAMSLTDFQKISDAFGSKTAKYANNDKVIIILG